MGIRVQKMVGWGTNDFCPADPEAFDEKRETLSELSSLDWLAWMLAHEDEIKSRFYDGMGISRPSITPTFIRNWHNQEPQACKLEDPTHCFAYDPEFGHETTIVLYPHHMAHKCRRRDNLIDWFEESERMSHNLPSVRFLQPNRGIYPFTRGEIPYSVIGLCIFLGIEDVIPKLKESLYVFWG